MVRLRVPNEHMTDLSSAQLLSFRLRAYAVILGMLVFIALCAWGVVMLSSVPRDVGLPRARLIGVCVLLISVIVALVSLSTLIRRILSWPVSLSAALGQGERIRALTSSRRTIVEAYDIERRRIERDLHDGAQQHLVLANMKVGEAILILELAGHNQADCPDSNVAVGASEPAGTCEDVNEALRQLRQAQTETDQALAALRSTVSGMQLQLLSDRGLEAAVKDMATRSPVPVSVHVPQPLPVLPEGVRSTAYFTVAEALTNVFKYAPGASASVLITAAQELRIRVVDTGTGGAHLKENHGLAGLSERLQAFGGSLSVSSPPGGPTAITATIPLLLHEGELSVCYCEPGSAAKVDKSVAVRSGVDAS